MVKDTPSRCAGLVTFATSVSLIGDATTNTEGNSGSNMYGDRLSDEKALRKEGSACGPLLSRPVSQARTELAERLFQLKPRGSTALGPAVVAGLCMLKVRGGERKRGNGVD